MNSRDLSNVSRACCIYIALRFVARDINTRENFTEQCYIFVYTT